MKTKEGKQKPNKRQTQQLTRPVTKTTTLYRKRNIQTQIFKFIPHINLKSRKSKQMTPKKRNNNKKIEKNKHKQNK